MSGDRDLLQVVADDPVAVRVLYVGRGLAKAELFGPEEVAAKYGVPADRAGAAYAELALLRGDSSDGLPGVKGVGEKTASTLLLRHGSLRDLRAAAADPARRRRKGNPGQTGRSRGLSRRRPSRRPGRHRRRRPAVAAGRPAACARRLGATRQGRGGARNRAFGRPSAHGDGDRTLLKYIGPISWGG